jgi:hypothetical protein
MFTPLMVLYRADKKKMAKKVLYEEYHCKDYLIEKGQEVDIVKKDKTFYLVRWYGENLRIHERHFNDHMKSFHAPNKRKYDYVDKRWWTDGQIKRLMELLKLGYSHKEIAEILSMPLSRVRKKVSYMGKADGSGRDS